MTQKEKLSEIIKALDSKKAENIKAIKIGDLTIIADYFVHSQRHIHYPHTRSCG